MRSFGDWRLIPISTMCSMCVLLFPGFAYHECMCVSVGSGRGEGPGALACMCGGAPPKYHVAKGTMRCFKVGPHGFAITGLIILTCRASQASQACITRGHKAGVTVVTTVLCALIGGHLRAIKWCQTCSQLMLARPDVREIMMRETTLLGLAQFKRHPKQLVFEYVIFHTSRARWAMRSAPRTASGAKPSSQQSRQPCAREEAW